jgi:hypothetical protein
LLYPFDFGSFSLEAKTIDYRCSIVLAELINQGSRLSILLEVPVTPEKSGFRGNKCFLSFREPLVFSIF